MKMLNKELIPVPGATGQDSERFHYAIQTGAQFKIYEL